MARYDKHYFRVGFTILASGLLTRKSDREVRF